MHHKCKDFFYDTNLPNTMLYHDKNDELVTPQAIRYIINLYANQKKDVVPLLFVLVNELLACNVSVLSHGEVYVLEHSCSAAIIRKVLTVLNSPYIVV